MADAKHLSLADISVIPPYKRDQAHRKTKGEKMLWRVYNFKGPDIRRNDLDVEFMSQS